MNDYVSRLDAIRPRLRAHAAAVEEAEAALWLARLHLDAAIYDAVRREELQVPDGALHAGVTRPTVYTAVKREAEKREPQLRLA